jgi:Protein of unknown function (DUF2752)
MLNRNHPAPAHAAVSAGSDVKGPLFLGRAALAVAAIGAYAAYMMFGGVQCSFAAVTHHPCPACGGTRSVHALLHGDVVGAIHYNPIAPLFVIVLGALALRAVWITARDGHLRALGQGTIGSWMVRGLVFTLTIDVIVWIARFFGLFGGPVPV